MSQANMDEGAGSALIVNDSVCATDFWRGGSLQCVTEYSND